MRHFEIGLQTKISIQTIRNFLKTTKPENTHIYPWVGISLDSVVDCECETDCRRAELHRRVTMSSFVHVFVDTNRLSQSMVILDNDNVPPAVYTGRPSSRQCEIHCARDD